MIWELSHRFDRRALPLADRHYNRRKVGSPQFVPPGRCVVLLTGSADALWVTSWPFAKYVRHAWPGAWVNSLFRNESGCRASSLIREAIAATCAIWDVWDSYRALAYLWPAPPAVGVITFVNPDEVDGVKVRGETVYGWTYMKAGFRRVGLTKGGLWAWQLLPSEMPEPTAPNNSQLVLTA